jgi:hypothetical protein
MYIAGIHFLPIQVLLNFSHGDVDIVEYHKIHGNLINEDIIEANIDTKDYSRSKLTTSENDHQKCYNHKGTMRYSNHE